MDCSYMYSKHLTKKKQKILEFFWFFALLQVRRPSKNQKKNSRKTKKNIFWPETKTSPKSFGFFVFWFSRGFVKILFCWKRRVLLKEEEFLRFYTTFWKYKIDAKKKQTFKHSKKQQNSANTCKFWESMGLVGGVPYIYIYLYLHRRSRCFFVLRIRNVCTYNLSSMYIYV